MLVSSAIKGLKWCTKGVCYKFSHLMKNANVYFCGSPSCIQGFANTGTCCNTQHIQMRSWNPPGLPAGICVRCLDTRVKTGIVLSQSNFIFCGVDAVVKTGMLLSQVSQINLWILIIYSEKTNPFVGETPTQVPIPIQISSCCNSSECQWHLWRHLISRRLKS